MLTRKVSVIRNRTVRRVWEWVVLLAGVAAMSSCQFELTTADADPAEVVVAPQSRTGLLIATDSDLPLAYPHRHYEFRFQAASHGSTVLHWKVEKGALPTGMKLDDSGLLFGEPERPGEFQFTVSVMENGDRESAVQKGFLMRVVSALALEWKAPAHVNANRIEGSVQVSNTTPDDIDLTYDCMAVASNGRATAIGYQHFVLKRGTVAMELPFGETLPRGGYVIYVDAIGEVAARNLIYREHMHTPGPLQVNVGP
jgi:hypothetical protein